MDKTTPVSSMIRQNGPIKIAAWRLMMEKYQDFMTRFEHEFRARHELSANEFDVLINASAAAQVRQRDLLHSLVISRSALSRLLGKLEGRGLVTQEPDPEDQRGVLVTLSEAGAELCAEAAETNGEIILAAFSGLTDGEADEDLRARVQNLPSGVNKAGFSWEFAGTTGPRRGSSRAPPFPRKRRLR